MDGALQRHWLGEDANTGSLSPFIGQLLRDACVNRSIPEPATRALMDAIRALIVDDEPLGRERIRTLLDHHPEVDIGGECQDGEEAVKAIRKGGYDLVFLDVQMPHKDGFEVIRQVGVDRMPPVIFVTAYDQYALRAFEVHALDYLLKPFDVDRFDEALDRVVKLTTQRPQADREEQMLRLLEDLKPKAEPAERLMIKTHQRIIFVRTEEIDWFEAAGNYIRIHVGKKTHLLRQTMSALEKRLDPKRFLRIHRSTIVNLDRVRDLRPMFNGEYEVALIDGTKLTLSRGYRKALERFTE